MIGFLLERSLGGSGGCCVGFIVACCLAVGLYKCSQCRLRACCCCRSCLLCLGVDKFADFEQVIIIHECAYSAAAGTEVCVRITAGDQVVVSDPGEQKFQQALSVFIEQGTPELVFDVMDRTASKVHGTIVMRVKDIVKHQWREKRFALQEKHRKGVINISLVLSFKPSDFDDKDYFPDLEVGNDTTGYLVRDHLEQVRMDRLKDMRGDDADELTGPNEITAEERAQLSNVELLAAACEGELDHQSFWGEKDRKYVAVNFKKKKKKPFLGVWADKRAFLKDETPLIKIDVMAIRSVVAHPQEEDSFVINEAQKNSYDAQHTFFRIDRARDVWVETLSLYITEARKEKDRRKGK